MKYKGKYSFILCIVKNLKLPQNMNKNEFFGGND